MTLKHAQHLPPTLSRDSSFCTLLCTTVCDQSKGTRGQTVERCFSQGSSCRVTACQQLGTHQTNLQSCGLRWISPTAFCPWIFSLKKGNSSSLSLLSALSGCFTLTIAGLLTPKRTLPFPSNSSHHPFGHTICFQQADNSLPFKRKISSLLLITTIYLREESTDCGLQASSGWPSGSVQSSNSKWFFHF